ncbi:hypothetical protein JX265_002074 [Neoarthrinium moseri]|uniref:Uncharacterized protein n=1 Tax=Neoarthrinium moseri TaxID=1658444 RepID=A0A9P9WWR6_9PEZI|nr:hypothetical protein JX265_002074 [Neoarthrinium moseri]
MVIPSDHAGHPRPVSLLKALQRIPIHSVPFLSSGAGLIEKEVWVLSPENGFDYFVQWIWELDQGTFGRWSLADENPETAKATAAQYQNFSAFLAHLLSAGVVEATHLSAIIKPAFFGTEALYREPPQSEPYVPAGAQWMLYESHALYDMCDKRAFGGRILSHKWSIGSGETSLGGLGARVR